MCAAQINSRRRFFPRLNVLVRHGLLLVVPDDVPPSFGSVA
jgi:hypothetical protein